MFNHARGRGLGPKSLKTELTSSVSGMLCEIVVQHNGGRCWGAGKIVVVVVGVHVWAHSRGRGLGQEKTKNLQPKPPWLSFGKHLGCRKWRGVLWCCRSPTMVV